MKGSVCIDSLCVCNSLHTGVMELIASRKHEAAKEAIKICDTISPGLWATRPDIQFLLHCQVFIEYIREGNPKDALYPYFYVDYVLYSALLCLFDCLYTVCTNRTRSYCQGRQ